MAHIGATGQGPGCCPGGPRLPASGALLWAAQSFQGGILWSPDLGFDSCPPLLCAPWERGCGRPARHTLHFVGRASFPSGAHGWAWCRGADGGKGSGVHRCFRRARRLRPAPPWGHRGQSSHSHDPMAPRPWASPPSLPVSLTTGPSVSHPVKRCGHVFVAVSSTFPLSLCVYTMCIPSGGFERGRERTVSLALFHWHRKAHPPWTDSL